MHGVHRIVVLIMVVSLFVPSVLGSFYTVSESKNQSLLSTDTTEQTMLTSSPLGGSRYNIQGWVYVNVKGDPLTRGYQYGYLAGEEIIDLMYRWSKMILNHPRIKPLRPFLSEDQYESIALKWWDFCTNLAESMYWDEYPDEYRQEIRGIAAGVNERRLTFYGDPISYKDVLASNEMYEMLSKITDRKIRKGIHPLLSFFALIQPTISEYSTLSAEEFVDDFIVDASTDTGHHHCSSFIATGNATKNDEVIISNSMWSSIDGAGMWWWSYYIAIRWNIILDVIPEDGHRFQMSCAPGYIWSDHDFYQNEQGITFIETTLPQGAWSEQGLPLAVRARKAVQYSSSIDDVIRFLRTDNDGVMNAVWLIGDTKTGEITRYELGLYHDALIERTTDGFQWSSNNPMDFWVRWEKMDWKLLIQQYIYHLVLGLNNYQYHTPWYLPATRDIAFEALGNKYYGEIDVEIVKQIMGADPIGTHSPDCKITSTSLLDHNGMLVHSGHPGGATLSMANFDSPDVYYKPLKPNGWVEVFGLPEDHLVQISPGNSNCPSEIDEAWKISLEEPSNDFYAHSTRSDNIIYSTTSEGMLYAVSAVDEELLWSKEIGNDPTKPVISDHRLFVGSDEGLHMLDLGWMRMNTKLVGEIVSVPVVCDERVYVGSSNHYVYAIDQVTGVVLWQIKTNGLPFLSNVNDDLLTVASEETLYAVNVTDGSVVWTWEAEGLLKSCPFQKDGMVFVGSWDTNLYALNQSSGNDLWMIDTGWGIESTPVVVNDLVIFASHDQHVYAADVDSGNIIWQVTCHAGIHTDPVIWHDSVLVGSDDGRLYRIDVSSGEVLWCFAPGDTIDDATRNYVTTPIRSSVAVSNDSVFIGALGHLYCLD
jgi:outer membrane protein assembly factor BamB